MLKSFIAFIFLFNVQTAFAEEDPLQEFNTCLNMCYDDGSEEGFIRAKAAMETYKDDDEIVLLLKEMSCHCRVSEEHTDEMITLTDEVIKKSTRTLSVGVAWFQKSHISYFRNEYENSLLYSERALNTLKQLDPCTKKGDISYKEFYEGLCHMTRKLVFEAQGNSQMEEKEKLIIHSNYSWLEYPPN